MNIGFTGHRNKLADEASILKIEEDYPGATWIHGGADGFDTQVDKVARKLGKIEGETLIVIRPDYKRYPSNVAPLMRNQQIVEISNLMVACYDGRRNGGTFYTIVYAQKHDIQVCYLTPTEAINA